MQIRNQKLSTRGGNREDRADWKHQIVESAGFNDGLNVGRKNRRLKDDSRFLAWVIQWQFFRRKITRKTDPRVKMFDFRLNVDFEVLRSEVQQRSLDWILGKHPQMGNEAMEEPRRYRMAAVPGCPPNSHSFPSFF